MVVKREEGSGILRPQIAHAKAWGCLGTGAGGAAGAGHATRDPAFFAALAAISEGRIASSHGGVLIRDAAGNLRPSPSPSPSPESRASAWSPTRADRRSVPPGRRAAEPSPKGNQTDHGWVVMTVALARRGEKGTTMKVRQSLRSLKAKPGAQVVRRRGRVFVINKKDPRFKARQG